jgi:hypothetical protein
MCDGRLERARALWDEGVGVTEIARRIGHGATPDAVIGKARRAHWGPHPVPPLGMETRAALKAADPRTARNTETQRERRAERRKERAEGQQVETPPRVACEPQRLAVPTATFSRCQWITSDGRPWAMCDAAAVDGGPWCAEHKAVAWVRRPAVREAWVSAA